MLQALARYSSSAREGSALITALPGTLWSITAQTAAATAADRYLLLYNRAARSDVAASAVPDYPPIPLASGRLVINEAAAEGVPVFYGSLGIVAVISTAEICTRGSMGAVVPTGTAPPTVTLTGTPTAAVAPGIYIDILVGGNRGTATFRWGYDGSTWQETGIVTAATYLMPGTGITANFATGTPYSADNLYVAAAPSEALIYACTTPDRLTYT